MMVTNLTDETVDVEIRTGIMTIEDYHRYNVAGAEYADSNFHLYDHPLTPIDEGGCPEHVLQMTREQRDAWIDGYNGYNEMIRELLGLLDK